MLKSAYLFAKIGADTAENKRKFAEILPKFGNYLTGRRGSADLTVAERRELRAEAAQLPWVLCLGHRLGESTSKRAIPYSFGYGAVAGA